MEPILNTQNTAIQKPEKFNFAIDVIDHWAALPGNLQAMQWVSQDESCTQTLTFKYLSRQSHRIAVLLEQLGVKVGDTMIIILPRVPAWSVCIFFLLPLLLLPSVLTNY